MRLFTIRLLKQKHPFSADNNHLHHLLLKKFSYYEVIIINQLIIFIPVLLNLFFLNTLTCLCVSLILYSFIIYKTS